MIANQFNSFCCNERVTKFYESGFIIIFIMEKALDKVLEDLINIDRVSGCVISDKQGLCLGCKGTASPESSGLITALSEFAKKLHPNDSTPTIVLENNEKQCLIQSNDKLIVSIYKNVTV